MKGFLVQARWLALIFLSACLAVFMLQNMAKVELHVLAWSFTASRASLVLICVGIGFVMGWVFSHSVRRR